ncbi:ferritin-like domain-containing protein [Tranquillimonas alkanivorans]|uniref:Ferritin-like metal-binding protein YciE n=1 Tax=Tranquillimonas alkanivorans TaxID=441119 RepID=A0A1I5WIP6_9RHOB|nr:ferritin-like domain-containing protein [Tranquillimonas alkanivorans]SFQ19527.1 Ferritin-like metal-binding protein YciE [Tranquillimonas alkanivorans]
MAMNSLKDVYIDQLQDLYSACRQSLECTTKLGEAAKDEELGRALKDGATGIADGMDKIATICGEHGVDPTGEHCKGMEGLVKEAKLHALEEDYGDDDVRDAMIISQYQRMVHYAIAGYGTVVAFANRLGLDSDADALKTNLEETKEGDVRMNKIAQGGVNERAA